MQLTLDATFASTNMSDAIECTSITVNKNYNAARPHRSS